jgi:hypothetical protein
MFVEVFMREIWEWTEKQYQLIINQTSIFTHQHHPPLYVKLFPLANYNF